MLSQRRISLHPNNRVRQTTLDTAESISFSIGSGNGAGAYNALLQIVSLRVAGTQTSNGCSANSNGVAVKKVAAVDP